MIHNKIELCELFYKVKSPFFLIVSMIVKTSSFLLLSVFCIFSLKLIAQQTDTIATHALVSEYEMQIQQVQYQNDSLLFANRFQSFSIQVLEQQVDSLSNEIRILHAASLLSAVKIDTLERQKLKVLNEMLAIKQQNLALAKEKEDILVLINEKDFQLSNCKTQLKDAQVAAAIIQSKLEGKIDVKSANVEGKEKEIAYLQKTVEDKNAQLNEKSIELTEALIERKVLVRKVDSLSQELAARDLQLAKVTERLRIIEAQYNEMLAQRTAATNKKKKIRFVQGVGLKNYRTPDWQLAPQSSATTSTYVITNKNSGNIEFDYVTGISLSLYDLSKPDGKFTYDAGLFVGFGGTNLFKNFYIAPSCKAFDYFHFMAGFNIAEYQQLQKGFTEGDALPGGMSIPTVKEWKANFFFGMTIDFELLANMPKKM